MVVFAAGVLPYAQVEGVTWFLIGREVYGRAQNTWADFGGSRHSKSENIATCAAREFTEETLGLLMLKAEARQKLGPFIDVKTSSSGRGYYRMYLMPIDYDPKLPGRYSTTYAYLRGIKAMKPHLEKKELMWIRAEDLFALGRGSRVLLSSRGHRIVLRDPFAMSVRALESALLNPKTETLKGVDLGNRPTTVSITT